MNKWTREETIIAFNVYCKIPFSKCNKHHPLIIEYAQILGRTPSALNMKVGNIGRFDPDLQRHGITGLAHGAKLEKEIWNEFYGNPELLAYESERLLAQYEGRSIETMVGIETADLPLGEEREVAVRQRVNQSFFRTAVLTAYDNKCCISGVGNQPLLEACHIVDWSDDVANRTNPKNGLCMNVLFHKAYDKQLLAITPDMTIVVSEEMYQGAQETAFYEYLKGIDGRTITMPERFLPQRELLEVHYNKYLGR